MNTTTDTTDLLIIGAGIVGLAHAAEALRRGLSVTVLERDAHAVGASVRNFGHVCATAQSGAALEYALAARERWIELGAAAGIDVIEDGTLVLARHEDEARVLREFAASRPAGHVRLLTPAEAAAATGQPVAGVLLGAHLPLDLRVDPRQAVPALAAWLPTQGADVRFGVNVTGISPLPDAAAAAGVPSGHTPNDGAVVVSTNRGEL